MNSIRKYISQVVGEEEDQMDIDDNNFTEQYLSQFPSIDSHTIDALISNGYQNKESLLAFDLKEDLPFLPDVNMAQKSLLRKVLQKFHADEQLESKVNDIKGVDDDVVPNTSQVKRKRGALGESSAPTSKRSRVTELISDFDSDYGTYSSDSLTARVRPSVSGRESIRSSTQHNFEPEVNSNLFEFINTRKSTGSRLSNRSNVSGSKVNDNDEDEESSEGEVVEKSRGRTRVETNIDTKSNSNLRPIFGSQTTARNSLANKSQQKRNSIRSPPAFEEKTETKSIPTPTELEVREHLAKKKALGKTGRRGKK